MRNALTLFVQGLLVSTATVLGVPSGSADACPPQKVRIKSKLEAAGGHLVVTVMARADAATIEIETEDVAAATSGEYVLLLRSDAEEREMARFDIDGILDAKDFELEEDLREFLMTVTAVVLVDGQTRVEAPLDRAALLRLRAATRGDRGLRTPSYGFRGIVVQRRDGEARYNLRVRVHGAEPGKSLTVRLTGSGDPFDIPVEVDGKGRGKNRVRDTVGLTMVQAMSWSEMVVLDDTLELARIPLDCR